MSHHRKGGVVFDSSIGCTVFSVFLLGCVNGQGGGLISPIPLSNVCMVECNQPTNIYVDGTVQVSFQWRASTSGIYTVSTCDASGDTVLVYDGTSYDDGGCSSSSDWRRERIQVNRTAGLGGGYLSASVRWIWSSYYGNISVTVSCPTISTPVSTSTATSSSVGSTPAACAAGTLVSCNQSTSYRVSGRSFWYFQWRALASGTYTVDTCSITSSMSWQYNTVLIYDGSVINGNVCGSSDRHESIRISSAGGGEYLRAGAGWYWSTVSGTITVTVTCPATATPTPAPTYLPTPLPTLTPTHAPTSHAPTRAPTTQPTTRSPTDVPISPPTTLAPSVRVTTTGAPTDQPTSHGPTLTPTGQPTTRAPTDAPTRPPTTTLAPSRTPTDHPSSAAPTLSPTVAPQSQSPSIGQTTAPSQMPTSNPQRPTATYPLSTPSSATVGWTTFFSPTGAPTDVTLASSATSTPMSTSTSAHVVSESAPAVTQTYTDSSEAQASSVATTQADSTAAPPRVSGSPRDADSSVDPASDGDARGSTKNDNDGGTASKTAFAVGAAVGALCIGMGLVCMFVVFRRKQQQAHKLESVAPVFGATSVNPMFNRVQDGEASGQEMELKNPRGNPLKTASQSRLQHVGQPMYTTFSTKQFSVACESTSSSGTRSVYIQDPLGGKETGDVGADMELYDIPTSIAAAATDEYATPAKIHPGATDTAQDSIYGTTATAGGPIGRLKKKNNRLDVRRERALSVSTDKADNAMYQAPSHILHAGEHGISAGKDVHAAFEGFDSMEC
eukprot:m.1338005 g.1338005  ORF g.1338005 m.1338005 type:complete len:782 (+) comp24883_c1_seq3:540-2885(+)